VSYKATPVSSQLVSIPKTRMEPLNFACFGLQGTTDAAYHTRLAAQLAWSQSEILIFGVSNA